MITLAANCLLFRLPNGESIPFSADMISVELMGDTAGKFDAEFVRHAANAVFHYFKHDLNRQTISVGEFAAALEKVLRGFRLSEPSTANTHSGQQVVESDLYRLARESASGCELFFFPRLRDELRHQLRQAPGVVRFRGLRECVKELAGARRWNGRCRNLEEQIVAYLRQCLGAEARPDEFALIVS